MYRILAVSLCALVVCAATASAAKIDFVAADNSTLPDNWASKYTMAYRWDVLHDPEYYHHSYIPDPANNPSYVNFTYGATSSGETTPSADSGSGATGTPLEGNIHYDLEMKTGKSFQFASLFYNPTYGQGITLAPDAEALRVRLIDPNLTTPEVWHVIDVADLQHGVFLQWDVVALTDQTITLDVKWADIALPTGVAGFFLDNVKDASQIPEPATLGLMLCGIAGIFIRRSKK